MQGGSRWGLDVEYLKDVNGKKLATKGEEKEINMTVLTYYFQDSEAGPFSLHLRMPRSKAHVDHEVTQSWHKNYGGKQLLFN
jgi:hypothetical protein